MLEGSTNPSGLSLVPFTCVWAAAYLYHSQADSQARWGEQKREAITPTKNRISFAITRCLAQDGMHMLVSSQKQQNMDQTVATLQGEGLSMVGTVCHMGKAEDWEWLVAMLSNRVNILNKMNPPDSGVRSFNRSSPGVAPVQDKFNGVKLEASQNVDGAGRTQPATEQFNIFSIPLK
ncbi:Dehydrogenase/reductase SDR family member 4 [Manis javanica]|nr:Dehydrogenase/reductase SDR family member 4 [Manis javanica]